MMIMNPITTTTMMEMKIIPEEKILGYKYRETKTLASAADQCDLGKERGLFSGDCVNAPLVDHPSCFNQPEGTGIDILSPNTTNV